MIWITVINKQGCKSSFKRKAYPKITSSKGFVKEANKLVDLVATLNHKKTKFKK